MAVDTLTRPSSPMTDNEFQEAAKHHSPAKPGAVVAVIVKYVCLAILSIFVLLPFVWMLLSSFKKNNEIFTAPITWFPEQWQWHNYADIWVKSDMGTWLGNTIFLSVVVTLLQVLTGSFAAYGFSRIKFPGETSSSWPISAPCPCPGRRT